MIGTILTNQFSQCLVAVNGTTHLLRPRGALKLKKLKPMVGDHIEVDLENQVFDAILPRKNFLVRPVIANVDQVMIVMSMVEPEFSSLLVEKFLAYANFAKVKPLVVISKIDKKIDETKLIHYVAMLDKLGATVICYSKVTKKGLSDVIDLLRGKITALMGQSGVGKSSLLNVIAPDYARTIGEYSQALGRGKHQTKEVILLPFDRDSYIADTPGFSSFDLPMFKEDLAQCYPGFSQYFSQCKFNNCSHIHESQCAVKKAVDLGQIEEESYQNYVKIYQELKYEKERF